MGLLQRFGSIVLFLSALTTTAPAAELDFLRSKPFDEFTKAELTAAKQAAKELKLPKLVACADPGNMPLSNDKREGFQNKIAEIVAKTMGTEISFFWRPYLERGLTRDTFDNHECQVLLDLPADYADILTTRPIYRSTYVLTYREDKGLDIKSLDDPVLKNLKIGVFQHSGIREALANRGLKEGLDIQIIVPDADLRPELQPWRQVQRVVDGQLDLAAVWGPFAGWVKKQGAPLVIQPANLMDDTIPLEFSLAWGVRNTDVVLKLKIDMALDEAKDEIARVLADYGVPLVQCSNCIVDGNLVSYGPLTGARSSRYEERFTSVQKEAKLSEKASQDQIVDRGRLEAWLKEGVDVNSELYNAISGGDAERVGFLIEKGADVNKRDNIGHLALGLAASMRKTDLMEMLIKAGAKVNTEDADGMTALQHAINVNHVPSIALLAKNGADLERGTAKGYTALEIAISEGKLFAAKALIDSGAKVDVAGGPEAVTPLMVLATQLQPQQRMNQLSKGPTPLVIAEDLIKRKADVNAVSKDGVTALMIAAGSNNAPMIGLLLRAGADASKANALGKTAADIATEATADAALAALKFLATQPAAGAQPAPPAATPAAPATTQ